MNLKTITKLFILFAFLGQLAACNNSDSTPDTRILETTDSYTVEYIPPADGATQGKTSFQIKVTDKNTNDPVTGATVSINPVMVMPDKTHSTPVETVSESSTLGTYNAVAYYLMSSDGGTWTLNIIVNGETASITIDVTANMAAVTTLNALSTGTDLVMGTPRKYKLFRESLTTVGGGTYTLKFFIAAMETMMSWPAIDVGTTMNAGTMYELIVDGTLQARISTDASTWIIATNDGNGHFSINNLSLTDGVQDEIYVELTVNSEIKTTDANTASGANAYATFIVTP